MKSQSPVKSLQTIAAEWHGGQSSALYAYASSGTITHGLSREIVACFALAKSRELKDLFRLYVATAPAITKSAVESNNEFWHKVARNSDGSPVRCRKTGKMQVWKTRPTEFKQPVKYGLKECFYLTQDVLNDWVVAPE